MTINEANGHSEEKNGNKYLVLDAVDKNEEVWEGIKEKIEAKNGNEKLTMEKTTRKLDLSLMKTYH